MCGIFSTISQNNNVKNLVIEGLKKLEYRGYDSFGISIAQGNEIKNYKSIGEIPHDPNKIDFDVSGQIAIGHTRWATHGGVNTANAHPHLSQNEKYSIVHNGIIENYTELKKHLVEKHNYQFQSETDTEVIVAYFQILKDDLYRVEMTQLLSLYYLDYLFLLT